LVVERSSDSPRELTCSYRELPGDLKPGETVLFADGTVAMTVTAADTKRARLTVTLPGRLRSRQGLNLPGSELAVKSLTAKDLHDLDWNARHANDVQFVGLSFVRSPEDVAWLRRELAARKCPAKRWSRSKSRKRSATLRQLRPRPTASCWLAAALGWRWTFSASAQSRSESE